MKITEIFLLHLTVSVGSISLHTGEYFQTIKQNVYLKIITRNAKLGLKYSKIEGLFP